MNLLEDSILVAKFPNNNFISVELWKLESDSDSESLMEILLESELDSES